MKYYTIKEASRLLNRAEETLRRWCREGRLEYVMYSRKDGYRISEVEVNKHRCEELPVIQPSDERERINRLLDHIEAIKIEISNILQLK